MTSVFLIHFYNKQKYTNHLMNFNYSFVIKLIKQAQYKAVIQYLRQNKKTKNASMCRKASYRQKNVMLELKHMILYAQPTFLNNYLS